MVQAYFVSFNPQVPMEENLPTFESVETPEVQRLLQGAAGVLLPAYVSPWRYVEIIKWAQDWFPRLGGRFAYHGKIKQVRLFRELGVRHPESLLFASPASLMEHFGFHGSPWDYPVVLKGDTGGGGSAVFPINSPDEMVGYVGKLPPGKPALLQRWVYHGGRDLRVVIYGDLTVSYFRVGDGRFYNNVCRGGRIDYDGRPEEQAKGIDAVIAFCRRVPIDIAGFDLMFPDHGDPVFVEINFNFGRKGLGGKEGHLKLLKRAIHQWRDRRSKEVAGQL